MATSTKPATVLSRDQRRRAEALEHARRIILGTVGGPLVVRVANGPCDATDVLRVAGWILDGVPAVDVVADCGRCGHPAGRHNGPEGECSAIPCVCGGWDVPVVEEAGPVVVEACSCVCLYPGALTHPAPDEWREGCAAHPTRPVVDGPRPTLETVPLEDRWLSIPCRKGCVVAALPHAECIDAEGDVLG